MVPFISTYVIEVYWDFRSTDDCSLMAYVRLGAYVFSSPHATVMMTRTCDVRVWLEVFDD